MNKKYILLTLLLVNNQINKKKARHKPIISEDDKKLTKEDPYIIDKPEISLALYGSLQDNDHYYKIEAEEDFNLYIGILTPNIDGSTGPKNKVYFKFYNEQFNEIKFNKYPTGIVENHKWTSWYERFGRKNYWVGPQVGTELNKPITPIYPKGNYYIKVFNQEKKGNYSLAVGYKEEFGFFDIIKLFFGSTLKNLDKFWENDI